MRGTGERRAGFTIIELMVAMALMVILTGVIVFIFAKSRDVVLFTEAQAQVFQNARYAMDLMAKDISGIIETIDMEPFEDVEDRSTRMFNQHYDRKDSYTKVLGGPHEERYDYSLTIKEDTYERPERDEMLTHWSDSIFMKTTATAKGRSVEGFVTYYLDEVEEKRPILRRRFEWFDREKLMMEPQPARQDDICFFVTDFRIEFYYIDYRDALGSPRKPGVWLTPKAAHAQGILDPDPRPETFVFNYHYEEEVKTIDPGASGRGKLLVNAYQGNRVTFTTASNFLFPQLVPGDKIYIFGAIPKKPPGQIPWLFDQELTIADIDTSSKQISFQERVIIQPTGTYSAPSVLFCGYRAAYLPAAIRITMRVKDQRADAIRTIQRVFWVRGS